MLIVKEANVLIAYGAQKLWSLGKPICGNTATFDKDVHRTLC